MAAKPVTAYGQYGSRKGLLRGCARTRNGGNELELWCCTNQPLHRDNDEKCKERRNSLDADRRINLANPGTERRMSGMRGSMVSMARLFCLQNKTARRADCKGGVEQDHPNDQGREPTLHFIPSRTCRISATDSSPSQARGPTARPTARPSGWMSTVVGKPRTINDRETSWLSSNRTGRRIPR